MIIRALIVWSAPTEKGWWGISVSSASSHSDGYSLGSTLNSHRLLSQIPGGTSDLSLNGQVFGKKSARFMNSSCLDHGDTKGGLLSSLFQFLSISSITPLVLFCNVLRQGWRVWISAIWLTRSDCRIYSSYVNASIKHFMRNYSNNSYIYKYIYKLVIALLRYYSSSVGKCNVPQCFRWSVVSPVCENVTIYSIVWLKVIWLFWKCLMFSHTVIKMPFSSVVMWHLHIHEVTTAVLPFIRLHKNGK